MTRLRISKNFVLIGGKRNWVFVQNHVKCIGLHRLPLISLFLRSYSRQMTQACQQNLRKQDGLKNHFTLTVQPVDIFILSTFQDAQILSRGLWLISELEPRRFEPGGVGDRVRGGLESCDAAGPRAATSIIRLLLYAAASLPLPPDTVRPL